MTRNPVQLAIAPWAAEDAEPVLAPPRPRMSREERLALISKRAWACVLRPDDPDGELFEAVAQVMWHGFVDSAWNSAEFRKAFTAATGLSIAERKSAIAAMVDKATGYGSSVAAEFIQWVTIWHYGLSAAPRAVRAAIAAGTFVAESTAAARSQR